MTTERELAEAAGLDQKDPRYEEAIFGAEVENFVDNHPIGRYLVERAKSDLEEAKTELLATDPTDSMKIRAIQAKAGTAANVRDWLREAIMAGRAARFSLEQEHAEHGGN